MRRSLALLAASALASFTGCHSFKDEFPMEDGVPMTPGAVAQAAGLTDVAWSPFPLHERTRGDVRGMNIVGDTLYVLDTNDEVHAIQTGTGVHRWIVRLDRTPDRMAVGPQHVAFMAKSYLTVATKDSGTITLRKDLDFTPSSGIALSGDSLYAGSWGKGYRLRSVSLADGWSGWSWPSDEPVIGSPVVTGGGADQLIYFASQDSRVVSLPPRAATGAEPDKAVWSVKTLGKNDADLTADGDTVYVASTDHALYALNRLTGSARWRWFGANVPLTEAPKVASDAVYQPFDGAIASIDKATGNERWRYVGGERFLARVGALDFVKRLDGSVAVLDAMSGKENSVIQSPLFVFLPTNELGGAFIFSDGKTVYAVK